MPSYGSKIRAGSKLEMYKAEFRTKINMLKSQRQRSRWINIKVESYLLSQENWYDLEVFSLLGKVRD